VLPTGERLSLSSRGVVRVIWLVALALAAWAARRVLLLGFFSVLLAVALSFPVSWLERVLSRGAAVLVVLALLVLFLTGIGWAAAPPLASEIQSVAESTPRTLQHARDWWDHLTRAPGEVARQGPSSPAPPALAAQAAQAALPAARGAVLVVTEGVLVLVLALFLVYRPEVYRSGVRLLVPAGRLEVFDELVSRLTTGLRRWVGGILVSMLIMGSLTAGGLLAVGIENWALLGVLTFLGTFVPYLGAIASAVPGLLVSLGQSPRAFALALVVYAIVHVVEGYVVEPVVMRRAVQVEPALLLAGQAIIGSVFGVLGVAVATPVVVCARIAVEYLWVERRARAPTLG
jgi:predicted PurR-regulated permease PerM